MNEPVQVFSEAITRAAPRLEERGDATPIGKTGMDSMSQDRLTADAQLEAQMAALESEMPGMQFRAGNVFALGSAWAERHDAIISATPPALRGKVEARLRRIGIRWGMMPGARMTQQFPALPPRGPDGAS